jgi:hypothetical protein
MQLLFAINHKNIDHWKQRVAGARAKSQGRAFDRETKLRLKG